MNQRQIVLWLVAAVLTLGWAHGIGAQPQPVGELVYAMHVTIPPPGSIPPRTAVSLPRLPC
jgi:hypothetical protein